MKTLHLTAARNFAFVLFAFFSLSSCKKETPVTAEVPTNKGIVEYVGTLVVNANWQTPASTADCANPARVIIELKGPNGFSYTKTISSTPVRLEERLANGLYTFTITKSENSCADFSPVTKTGSVYISGCPTVCESPTVLNLNLD